MAYNNHIILYIYIGIYSKYLYILNMVYTKKLVYNIGNILRCSVYTENVLYFLVYTAKIYLGMY